MDVDHVSRWPGNVHRLVSTVFTHTCTYMHCIPTCMVAALAWNTLEGKSEAKVKDLFPGVRVLRTGKPERDLSPKCQTWQLPLMTSHFACWMSPTTCSCNYNGSWTKQIYNVEAKNHCDIFQWEEAQLFQWEEVGARLLVARVKIMNKFLDFYCAFGPTLAAM